MTLQFPADEPRRSASAEDAEQKGISPTLTTVSLSNVLSTGEAVDL